MPLPQTICDRLLEELNGFVIKGIVPDLFTQARLKRETETLKKVSPAEAYLCSAILHTLNANAEGMRKDFEKVFFHLPNDSDMHYNFSGSLLKLGYANEALDQIMRALSCSRASREILLDVANLAHVTFRTDVLLEAIDMYIKATQDESVMQEPSIQLALDIATALQDHGIEPTTVNAVYQAAETVVVKFSKTIDKMRFIESKDFGGSLISVFAGIQADPHTVSEMNLALADELVDRELLELMPEVSYAFTPA